MDDGSKLNVEVAIDRDLAEAARSLGLDLDEVMEAALRRRLGRPKLANGESEAERVAAWRREHADAIACRNEIIDREGFFGEEWRTF